MDIINDVLENNLSNKNIDEEIEIEVTEKNQKNFLETNLGKVINSGIDIGLRVVLPDFLENEVIEVKDALISGGLKEGINTAIENTIDLGKSAIGIFTGKFENLSQAQNAIKKGGLIEKVSDVIDFSLKAAVSSGIMKKTTSKMIDTGKKEILNSITNNIEESFSNQIKSLKKVEEYSGKWNECYTNEDFSGMEKAYKNMNKYLKEIIPLEKTITDAKQIENLHTLIKNRGGKFNLSEIEKELASKLS